MAYFQVTFDWHDGHLQNDIVTSGISKKAALVYAKMRAEQLNSKPAVSVKRISKAVAEDMVYYNAINWTNL